MKKLIKLFNIIFAISLIASCSKERKIERNLYNKGGEWNISHYNYLYSSSNPGSPLFLNDPESFENCGKFTFNKNGSGSVEFTVDGSETQSFTYSNTEDKLTIVFNSGGAETYDLQWSKDNVYLTKEKTSTDPAGFTEHDNEYFILKKK